MLQEHLCKRMLCDRALSWNVWLTQVHGKDISEFPMQVRKTKKKKEKRFWLDGCMEWETNLTFD